MLDGAVGFSRDETATIISKTIGLVLTGLTGGAQTGGIVPFVNAGASTCAPATPVVSISDEIDPLVDAQKDALNDRLHAACVHLDAEPRYSLAKKNRESLHDDTADLQGFIYSTPGVVDFTLSSCNDSVAGCLNRTVVRTWHLTLAQGGPTGRLELPRGQLATNEYDVVFDKGMLIKSKIVQPSELLAGVMIVPNALREIFAIPTELIQLKIDTTSKSSELINAEAALLAAQAELDAIQATLD
tara:strand:+ start:2203 stop:2931 length:729 start_codon:yes stop_codon:yes gene_type:complete